MANSVTLTAIPIQVGQKVDNTLRPKSTSYYRIHLDEGNDHHLKIYFQSTSEKDPKIDYDLYILDSEGGIIRHIEWSDEASGDQFYIEEFDYEIATSGDYIIKISNKSSNLGLHYKFKA